MHLSAASTDPNLWDINSSWSDRDLHLQYKAVSTFLFTDMAGEAADALDLAEWNGEFKKLVLGKVGRKTVDVDVGSLLRAVHVGDVVAGGYRMRHE